MALAGAHGLAVLMSFAFTFQLDALTETGTPDEGDALLAGAGLDGDLPDLFNTNAVLARRGRVRVAQGRLEEGLADLTEAGRRLDRARIANPTFGAWRSDAALALAALGRGDEGRALAVEELTLARAVGQPRSIGMALRALARCAEPDPIARLDEAVVTLATSPDRLQEAYALADLGTALRVAGRRDEARGRLRRALDQATRLGAAALAERAREELIAAGARPRRAALTGAAALTPSELRCARMAADGLTNRDIAQRLFVTVRAVEMHLTATYKKLGIGSRAEVASALRDDALA
jgi:DNA-binding CsgD family transcriptional regulator